MFFGLITETKIRIIVRKEMSNYRKKLGNERVVNEYRSSNENYISRDEFEHLENCIFKIVESKVDTKIKENNIDIKKLVDDIIDKKLKKIDTNNVNLRLRQLENQFQNEINKNNKLIQEIITQRNQINELNKKVIELENLIKNNIVQNSYKSKKQTRDENIVVNKEESFQNQNIEIQEEKVKPEIKSLFTLDDNLNKKVISKFIIEVDKLKDTIIANAQNGEENKSYIKLVDMCREKFISLQKKMTEKSFLPDKIASQVGKILKSTIIKGISHKSISTFIEKYLSNCNIRKVRFDKGYKLKDEDYEYIEECVIYQDVNDKNLDNCILKKERDAYVIVYEDEDGLFETIIPGIYILGRYVKE